MTLEEHNNIVQEIAKNLTDQATVTTLLTQLTEDYKAIDTENNTLKTQFDEIKNNNEKLKQANMELFLKVGQPIQVQPKEEETKPSEPQLKYDDLFNEKGGLK